VHYDIVYNNILHKYVLCSIIYVNILIDKKVETMTGKEAKKRIEKQFKRQNEHIKENYDRVSVTLPKGTKDRIKALGLSMNGYINKLVLEDLERLEAAQEPRDIVGVIIE
jgi:hypothetical protein